MTAYLDASFILPLLVDEKSSEVVDAFLNGSPDDMSVSDFASAEVSSAVSRLVRMGIVDAAAGDAILTDFDIWRATMTTTPPMAATDARLAEVFVRRFEMMLRAPDALHVAMCRRLDLTLVTLDRRLANAARALGLRVEVPGT